MGRYGVVASFKFLNEKRHVSILTGENSKFWISDVRRCKTSPTVRMWHRQAPNYSWYIHTTHQFSFNFIKVTSMIRRKTIYIATCYVWPFRGFGLEIGFIDHLQVVLTGNYNSIANFPTLQITIAHILFSQSVVVSTCHFLVTVF
jgi:hypothetical protein